MYSVYNVWYTVCILVLFLVLPYSLYFFQRWHGIYHTIYTLYYSVHVMDDVTLTLIIYLLKTFYWKSGAVGLYMCAYIYLFRDIMLWGRIFDHHCKCPIFPSPYIPKSLLSWVPIFLSNHVVKSLYSRVHILPTPHTLESL